MSITWGDSVRNHDRKQGASSAGASVPPAQDRPDYPLLVLKLVNLVAWTLVGIVLLNLYKLGII